MMPTAETISKLLADIVGRPVTAKKLPPIPLTGPGMRVVAVYESDDDSIAGACICDLTFAAQAAAALVMLPSATAQESIVAGKCSPPLLENLGEILSMCRQWFQ